MGAIISTFILGLSTITGDNYLPAVLVGNLGAVAGSIVSTRMMLRFTKGLWQNGKKRKRKTACPWSKGYRVIREGNLGSRFLGAILDGGAAGVKMGVDIAGRADHLHHRDDAHRQPWPQRRLHRGRL